MCKKPYRCPVCGGKGVVENGFYTTAQENGWTTTSSIPETCKSCGGTGIIWADNCVGGCQVEEEKVNINEEISAFIID